MGIMDACPVKSARRRNRGRETRALILYTIDRLFIPPHTMPPLPEAIVFLFTIRPVSIIFPNQIYLPCGTLSIGTISSRKSHRLIKKRKDSNNEKDNRPFTALCLYCDVFSF
jgi:hypothetical protein